MYLRSIESTDFLHLRGRGYTCILHGHVFVTRTWIIRRNKRYPFFLVNSLPKPTRKNPPARDIHRPRVKGCRNEKIPGFFLSGFLIIILISTFMKGLENPTSCSRSLLIDRGAMAMSASYSSIKCVSNDFYYSLKTYIVLCIKLV